MTYISLFSYNSNYLKPQFIQLANIWIGFQDELVLISVLSNVLYNLEPFAMVILLLLNNPYLNNDLNFNLNNNKESSADIQ